MYGYSSSWMVERGSGPAVPLDGTAHYLGHLAGHRGVGPVDHAGLRPAWRSTSRPCPSMSSSVRTLRGLRGSSNAVAARPADLRARKYHESGLRPNPVERDKPDGGGQA